MLLKLIKSLFGNTSNDHTLQEAIKNGAWLVDVRTKAEYDSGHVKGSVNIPLDEVQNQLKKFKDKNQIVVFCRSGNRSGMAKSILANNGITNVINGQTWNKVNALLTQK